MPLSIWRNMMSALARSAVSGVRNSCEASATKRRWALNVSSSRASISLNVSARCCASSRVGGGCRRCERSPVLPIERAVWLIFASGRIAASPTSQAPQASINVEKTEPQMMLRFSVLSVPLTGCSGSATWIKATRLPFGSESRPE